ncbi:alginate lyase family protein [Pleomorphovibrio marinus]|uniref:alginate lyase family protein n=1 Tax=Pleomorphovibrio marinus TaxID=2164132 RepID=UPI001E3B78EC|nr:alginate lyase family protein [Pleomorphovibrio marinus]
MDRVGNPSFVIAALWVFSIGNTSLEAQVMHPDAQLQFVKVQINHQSQPYWDAYQELIHYADQAGQHSHHALEDFAVPGFYKDPEGHRNNSRSLQSDSFDAYAAALAYRLSGEEKFAKKAIYFLNAWATTNKGYSEADGPLVMAYSGPGLMIAADLLKFDPLWPDTDREKFKSWVDQVYKKACNEIRERKNNWADWGRFGSVLSAAFLDNKEEMQTNINLVKSDLFEKIAVDGHMPEEVRRQERGLWYTYFSLAPITATCWAILQAEGTDLLHWEEDGRSVKTAIDYLLHYVESPDDWPWHEKQRPGSPDSWPGNLMEAMEHVYEVEEYGQYAYPARPVSYPTHHFAWTFPTLMKPKMAY